VASEEQVCPASVFVDVDGTLLDTTYLHTYAWWRALDDAHHRLAMAVIHPLIGLGSSELLTTLVGADDRSIAEAHAKYFACFRPFVRALPGASDLLRRINAGGGQIVLVTSAAKSELPGLLGPLKCDDVITDVVHGGMARRSKPSPDLFEVAVARAGADRDRSLALGDTVWDIQAATRAAVACVAVETGGTDSIRLEEAGALAVYSGCDEILGRWDTTPFAALMGAEERTDDRTGAQEKLVS
jgi:phosphoglycolate phosphatase-like HAD superfamily hydrolase